MIRSCCGWMNGVINLIVCLMYVTLYLSWWSGQLRCREENKFVIVQQWGHHLCCRLLLWILLYYTALLKLCVAVRISYLYLRDLVVREPMWRYYLSWLSPSKGDVILMIRLLDVRLHLQKRRSSTLLTYQNVCVVQRMCANFTWMDEGQSIQSYPWCDGHTGGQVPKQCTVWWLVLNVDHGW